MKYSVSLATAVINMPSTLSLPIPRSVPLSDIFLSYLPKPSMAQEGTDHCANFLASRAPEYLLGGQYMGSTKLHPG